MAMTGGGGDSRGNCDCGGGVVVKINIVYFLNPPGLTHTKRADSSCNTCDV